MTRPNWVDDSLFPFESRFVDIGGCTVHYVDEGQGPPILFLHGNPTWSFLYRDIIDLLRHRFRCIALDHPGFGLSSAPSTYGFTPAEHAHTVERFILEHDLGQLTVMGHDWGGPIGLGAASRHPDRIAAVIVANTWAWPANSSPFLQGFSRLAGGPPGRVLIERYNSFVELSMPLGTARTRVAPKVMEHYRRPFADPAARRPTWVFPRAILKSHNYLLEVERGLSRLADRPALILWGTRDVAFRGSARRRFERRLPQSSHHPATRSRALHPGRRLSRNRRRDLRLAPPRPQTEPGDHLTPTTHGHQEQRCSTTKPHEESMHPDPTPGRCCRTSTAGATTRPT